MTNDLGLTWEHQRDPRRPVRQRGGPQGGRRPPSGSPGHRGTPRGKKKRRDKGRRARSLGALLISMLLLGVLGVGVWWGVHWVQDKLTAPDYTSIGTETVTIEVKDGQSITEIGNTLYEAGVVKSAKAFVNAANQKGRQSKTIQVGFYKLHKPMPAADALAALLDPAHNMVVNKVTIPEGKTMLQTFALLSKATGIPEADFEKASNDPVALGIPDWWFKRADGKKSAKSVEGFLYPETYQFGPNETAESILKKMINQFLTVTGDMNFADTVQAKRQVSPYEALIVASLAQAEAGNADDLGKIARVAYNRVYSGKFPCNCLQFDVTVNYWLNLQGKPTKPSKDMTAAELDDPKNPYNTGPSSSGLPVGPIDSPGKAALQAAMDPPAGTWLYFVAIDKEGHSAFASTKAEHDKNTALACQRHITCP